MLNVSNSLMDDFTGFITLFLRWNILQINLWRVLRYTNLAVEGNLVNPNLKLPAQWPRGQVRSFFGVARYSNTPGLALRGVSFNFSPEEKIIIIGRTGSGKSTIIKSLCRLIELSEGSIEIDKVPITLLGTQTLRTSISYIAQAPFFFSGSLRSNLDIDKRHGEESLLKYLRVFQFAERVMAGPKKLGGKINKGKKIYDLNR